MMQDDKFCGSKPHYTGFTNLANLPKGELYIIIANKFRTYAQVMEKLTTEAQSSQKNDFSRDILRQSGNFSFLLQTANKQYISSQIIEACYDYHLLD
jgi:hypothetical protein